METKDLVTELTTLLNKYNQPTNPPKAEPQSITWDGIEKMIKDAVEGVQKPTDPPKAEPQPITWDGIEKMIKDAVAGVQKPTDPPKAELQPITWDGIEKKIKDAVTGAQTTESHAAGGQIDLPPDTDTALINYYEKLINVNQDKKQEVK